MKKIKQIKLADITFFRKDKMGALQQLPRMALDVEILMADGATLKLDNQKNGWEGVCVYQEANGDPFACPVRAVGRRYLHLRLHKCDRKDFISTWYN